MKCCLMSNVNMPVPPARGRSSLGLSVECGDISMDCLSLKMHFPTAGKKKTKKKQGQQNLAGGRSDEARFFRVSSAAVETREKISSSPCEPRGVVTGTY